MLNYHKGTNIYVNKDIATVDKLYYTDYYHYIKVSGPRPVLLVHVFLVHVFLALIFFLYFWGCSYGFCWIFLNFFFLIFCIFFWIFGFFSKLLRLLLNVMEVSTEHQKWLKISTNSVKSSYFARSAKKPQPKGQSPPQELEVSPRSGLYHLVYVNEGKSVC